MSINSVKKKSEKEQSDKMSEGSNSDKTPSKDIESNNTPSNG